MPTPLPDQRPIANAGFLARAKAAGRVPSDAVVTMADFFGDSVELADELLDLILHGPKRATASSYESYERDGEPVPFVGMLSLALDGTGRPRALLRTTDVRVGPLSSVDDQFAWDEGEGDRTRDSWLRDHIDFFERTLPADGLVFSLDMETVFERFEVVYTE
jgi:uncharacterized protein YhfF